LATCNITTVSINGIVVFDSFAFPSWSVEWVLFYPFAPLAGQPIWFAWHSNSSLYDTVPSLSLVALCDDGSTAVNGSIGLNKADVVMSYVTTTQNYSTLLVHLSSNITAQRTVSQVLVNGADMTSKISNVLSKTVAPYPGSALLEIPLSTPVCLRLDPILL
jgi:hypothetical protein